MGSESRCGQSSLHLSGTLGSASASTSASGAGSGGGGAGASKGKESGVKTKDGESAGWDTISVPVFLYVYDISKGLAKSLSPAFLGFQVCSTHHTLCTPPLLISFFLYAHSSILEVRSLRFVLLFYYPTILLPFEYLITLHLLILQLGKFNYSF